MTFSGLQLWMKKFILFLKMPEFIELWAVTQAWCYTCTHPRMGTYNSTLLSTARLRWSGHAAMNLDDERLPKRLFYSELTVDKNLLADSASAIYKDTVKASLKDFNINSESWEGLVVERYTWRILNRKGATPLKRTESGSASREEEWAP